MSDEQEQIEIELEPVEKKSADPEIRVVDAEKAKTREVEPEEGL